MPDFTRLRLDWEPRMLSISRIMIGLLFMEHGTAKVLDFPHQETHKAFDLLTLNPGAQGLIELIGGFLFALGLFTRPVAFLLAGDVAVAYSWRMRQRASFRCSMARAGGRLLLRLSLFLACGGGEWSLDRLLAGEPAIHRMPYAEDAFRR